MPASQTLDFMLSLGSDHVLSGRIDRENIGIVGYSQGGAGALAAVTEYDNGAEDVSYAQGLLVRKY